MKKPKNNILTLQTVLGYSVNTTGLIKQSIALNSQLDFLQPYATYADDLLVLNYSEFKLKSNIGTDTVKLYVCNALLSEKYNLETLIGTLDLDYNPIENYNMVEDGVDNRVNHYGERMTDSKVVSASKVTNNDNTHSVTPFNSNTMNATEKDVAIVTQQPYTDTSNQTEESHTDNDDLTHHLTRTGNVGVTTSQQMIEAQRALANVNVCGKIVEIVIKNICKGVQATI